MKTIVPSPFADCNAVLKHEKSKMPFRKEMFEYEHLYYECEQTKEHFTTSELSGLNIGQVYNQYRAAHDIPFPDELITTRKAYGITARQMSKALGFGENQYGLYERGEMPSLSNGKMLKIAMDPTAFAHLIEDGKIKERILKLARTFDPVNDFKQKLVFDGYKRGKYNGFAPQSMAKIRNVILYFVKALGPTFQTKMNKLLFYADYESYRTQGISITGLAYKALPFGAVPVNFDKIYALVDDIENIPVEESNYSGIKLQSAALPDMSQFTQAEADILAEVTERFKTYSSSRISEENHKESAWLNNIGNRGIINYQEAFNLQIPEQS